MAALTLTSRSLLIEIDAATGAVGRVRNLARDLDLIAVPTLAPAFRVHLASGETIERADEFRAEPRTDGYRLHWRLPHGISLDADVLVHADDIRFRIRARCDGTATIDQVEYPVLARVGRLGGSGVDELVHTHAGGMLFRDPVDLLGPDPANTRRLRRSVYPAGFGGSWMQFLGYYARGRGGFAIVVEDPDRSYKWFSVDGDGAALGLSVIHDAPHPAPGAGLAPGYDVVVAPLTRGSWYEVADRYRSFVDEQPWGRRTPRTGWLRDRVGLATFGINARHDRSEWLDAIHRMAGTPVFHVLGPNWAGSGLNYMQNLPGGTVDSFLPARFSAENIATIRRNGDYFAPFEFDVFCIDQDEQMLAARWAHDPTNLGLADANLMKFPLMCAGSPYWYDLHTERDTRLVAEYGPDALYYDISVNNLLMECLSDNHTHRAGSGTDVAERFARMYDETNAATGSAAGHHVPVGVETMSERFLDQFDYYQARGEAGPYAGFEVNAFRDWILAGRAEKIPLLTYVYGERAPLRLDGWAKLSAQAGDLFYWVAAQVVLGGGLFELNYEFSALEDLDGRSDNVDEHYFRFDERHYAIDPAKAAFLGEVARARTGAANPFLAHGRMLPAPIVEAPPITLDFHTYNVPQHDPNYDARGEMTVPSVLASAWQLEGRAIWLVANVAPHAQHVLVDGRSVELPGRSITTVDP